MGTYSVWVVGPKPHGQIREFEETNDIPGSYPGLTFDYLGGEEEPGPAYFFAALPDDSFPFALVTISGQIVIETYPGSDPDPSVSVGVDQMRAWLEANPNERVTPMTWHS